MINPESASPEPQTKESKVEGLQPDEVQRALAREQATALRGASETVAGVRQKLQEGSAEFVQESQHEIAVLENAADVSFDVAAELERLSDSQEPVAQEKGERVPENYRDLMAIRLTDNLPIFENGQVKLKTPMAATDGEIPRASLHFSLNQKVENHMGGDWDKRSIAILAPMDGLVKENGVPTGLDQLDTFWISGDAVRLPAGTKILYRTETTNDPRFQALKQQCEANKIAITFEEDNDMSGAALEQRLSALGFQPASHEAHTTLQKAHKTIAEKTGVRFSGNDKIHANSGLPQLEGAMMQSNPNQPEMFRQSPVSVLKSVEGQGDVLPADVTDQYKKIARTRLDRVLSDPDVAKKLFYVQAKEKFGPSPSAQELLRAEAAFYEELTDFALKRSDQTDLVNALTDKIGSDAFEEGKADQLFVKSIENLDAPAREKVIERFSKVGGPAAVQLMEANEKILTAKEKQKVAQGTLASMDAFRTGRNLKDLGPIMEYLKSNEGRDFFDRNFGPEFYNYFYKR